MISLLVIILMVLKRHHMLMILLLFKTHLDSWRVKSHWFHAILLTEITTNDSNTSSKNPLPMEIIKMENMQNIFESIRIEWFESGSSLWFLRLEIIECARTCSDHNMLKTITNWTSKSLEMMTMLTKLIRYYWIEKKIECKLLNSNSNAM